MSYKKWIGGGVGLLLGGGSLIAGALGYLLGSLFDEETVEGLRKELKTNKESKPETDFRLSLLLLSAFVIKADGRASRAELEYVRNFFVRRFGAEKANSTMRVFNELDKSNYSIDEVGAQVRKMLDYPSRLQLVHFLFGVATADRGISREEVHVIGRIATILGLHQTEFDSIRTMFRTATPESAYTILGVTISATNDEIKTAYRKLTLQYHPDKVAHHGEEVQRAAREKYLRVVEAYETIKKERGIA